MESFCDLYLELVDVGVDGGDYLDFSLIVADCDPDPHRPVVGFLHQ